MAGIEQGETYSHLAWSCDLATQQMLHWQKVWCQSNSAFKACFPTGRLKPAQLAAAPEGSRGKLPQHNLPQYNLYWLPISWIALPVHQS